MKSLFCFLLILISVSVHAAPAVAPKASPNPASAPVSQETLVDRERRRLEELFIWKMSEELKLPLEKEKPFAEAMRSLNREKAKANFEVTKSLDAITKAQALADPAKSRLAVEKAVKTYEKAVRSYGQLPIREVTKMRALLGADRLGRYLTAKAQMAEKLLALSAREDLATERSAPGPTATPKP